MLDNYHSYLLSEKAVKSTYVPYYVKWVVNCYSFLNIPDSVRINGDQKNQFLSHMAKSHEDWQVKQADNALRLFDYFLSRQLEAHASDSPDGRRDWISIDESMKKALRLRHMAYGTEKTYLFWLRSFRLFVREKDPAQLLGRDLQDFLSYLAVEKRCCFNPEPSAERHHISVPTHSWKEY